jgi:transposase
MPKAYADDLRRKVLQCHAKGEETLEELAERFAVSAGWVYKISAAYTRTGKMERQPPAGVGRERKATPEIEQLVRETIRQRPDTTLAELQVMLYADLSG